MGDKRADRDEGATTDAGRFGEWDDSDFDPHNLPDWDLEDTKIESDGEQAQDFSEFIDGLDEQLSRDVGYAQEKDTIDTLARMLLSDRPNFARAQATIRPYKMLALVNSAVKLRAQQLNRLSAVPGGGEATSLVLVKSQLPEAPVHKNAVVPAFWILDAGTDGPRRPRLIRKVMKRSNGEPYAEYIGVAWNPIVISATMISISNASANLRISWKSRDKWRHRVVAREKLMQPRELITALGGLHGFPVNVNNAKDVIAYLADYEAHNEDLIPTRPMTSQMGWQGKGGSLGFVAGRRHLKADDDTPAVHFVGADDGEEQLAGCVRTEGTLEGWAKAVRPASQFPAVEAALYASLAPALLDVLKAPNFTIDWAYKTGAGKTTSLMVGASSWGNPDDKASDSMIASWEMTQVGFENRAAALSCMPMIIDDTKRAKSYGGKSVVPGVVYAVANGQGKVRGSVKGMRKTSYWRTVMMSSGEQRIIDFDKSGGTPARVVELWGNAFGGDSELIADTIRVLVSGMLRNFGHAGPLFVQWLIDNRHRWDELRTEYDRQRTEYRRRMIDLSAGQSMEMAVMDRVAANLAVLDVAAQVLHQAVELPWELKDFVGELLPIVTPAAGAVDRELEALRAVVSWANANRGKFCVSDKHRASDEPHQGWLGFWEVATYPMQWEYLGVYPVQLRDFLRKQGYEPTAIIRQWAEAGWLERTEKGRLTASVRDLEGRPRMVLLSRAAIERAGGFSSESSDDGNSKTLPF